MSTVPQSHCPSGPRREQADPLWSQTAWPQLSGVFSKCMMEAGLFVCSESCSFQGLKFIISVLSFFQLSASQGAENRIQLAASRELQECPYGVPLEFRGSGRYSHILYPHAQQ